MTEPEYVLGTSDFELERLEFQQRVWERETRAWIDGLRLGPGGRVLDAGCGPGTALHLLHEAVGPSGSVVAVDESPRWIAAVEQRVAREGWTNVESRCGRIEGADLGPGGFDGILLRWVLSFPPDPQAIVTKLAGLLAPGGRLLVIDYNHEGISVFPKSPLFERVIEATRTMYASQGGDPWIAGRCPELFASAGLELERLDPIVLSGAPGSDVWQWAEVFFLHHAERMEAGGFLRPGEADQFRAEWLERAAQPTARFFSPIVCGALATKL